MEERRLIVNFLVLFGTCCILLALAELGTGEAMARRKVIARKDDPDLFWWTVGGHGSIGCGILLYVAYRAYQ